MKRRKGHEIDYAGKKYVSLHELCDDLDLPYAPLAHKYYRTKDIEQSVERAKKVKDAQTYTVWGREYKSLTDIAKEYGTSAAVISKRLQDGKTAEIELNDPIFGVEINEHLVHMAVLQQLANKRQGTQKAKTRSEVRGGGRKPWRQKGTGHARQGSTRSPQWTGGGVVFAPTPRDYSFKLNKKEKRAALKSALTSRVVENKFVVVDELKLDEIKTKKFVEVLKNLNVEKALVVLNDMDEKVIASAANIPTVKTTQTNELNVFDVLKYDTVVVTKAAVATIEEVYA